MGLIEQATPEQREFLQTARASAETLLTIRPRLRMAVRRRSGCLESSSPMMMSLRSAKRPSFSSSALRAAFS